MVIVVSHIMLIVNYHDIAKSNAGWAILYCSKSLFITTIYLINPKFKQTMHHDHSNVKISESSEYTKKELKRNIDHFEPIIMF